MSTVVFLNPLCRTFDDLSRAPSEEIANPLQPSLIGFFKHAWDEDVLPTYSKLFVLLGALKFPHGLQDGDRFNVYAEPGRFVKLYESSHFRLGDDEGILFHQETLKASFIEDYNDTMVITSHEWGWMPLEVILDSYLQMIDEEKYTKTDLERATAAFKRLVEVINSRIKYKDNSPLINLLWHDPAIVNQDIIPPSSFAHEFLKAISNCKVRFRYIAPGIRFPTVPEFMDQLITDFVTSPYNHLGQFPGNCPLRIVQIDAEQLVARDWHLGLRNLANGSYIHPVVQKRPLFWSNGCRLL
ncbi:hypothetical protein BJX76DRAFT_355498 [Aspergillus varians]